MKNIEKIINIKRTEEVVKEFVKQEVEIRERVNSKLKEKGLMYKGKISPLSFNPIIMQNGMQERLNNISSNYINLLSDFISLIQKEQGIIKEIIDNNVTYSLLKDNIQNMDVGKIKKMFYRLDGIIHNNEIKLIESNIDSPGGTFTLEKYAELGSEIYSKILNDPKGLRFNKFSPNLLNDFLLQYHSQCKNNELFLVMGERNDGGRFEHRMWAKKLRESGIPARSVDYKDKIKSIKDGLYFENKKVGIIYKRVFPIGARRDILEAEEKGLVHVLNPSTAVFLESKSLFALFHELKDNKLVKYKEFIERNIADTRLTSRNKESLIQNKDAYVIKEFDVDCGEGVYIGKAESNESWKKIISEVFHNSVAQKYLSQPKLNFLDNKIEGLQERKFDFNLFCIGEKTILPYIRVNGLNNYKSNTSQGGSNGICYFGDKK